jgi:tripartite-type tricarboxylate transporter receptor subunit TctC
MKRWLLHILVALLPGLACAQGDWPAKPVRFIVSQSAGGSIDIAARAIGQKLSAGLGQQFIVDNRPGANGAIAIDAAAKSAPDGYTFLLSSPGPLVINQFVSKHFTYDALRDFAPVTQIASNAFLMAVPVGSPFRSVQEVVAAARAKPGDLKYGSTGSGNQTHLAPELFAQASGTKMLHVPYKGEGPAIIDLISGQIDLMISTMPSLLQQVRAGKLRALAVPQRERSRAVPEVPTLAEVGVPGVEVTGWTGVMAPAGTPRPVVSRLSADIVKVLNDPEMREFLAKGGAEPVGSTPEAFAAFIKAETAKWGAAARAAGLKPE